MISVAASSTIWFLPLTLPIAVWVAWSDMSRMKIPNKAVLALLAVYLIAGPIILPFNAWAWGWALFAIVLVIGIVLTAIGAIGGGDAKFAAAMAPFFIGGDTRYMLVLFPACILGAVICHRIARASPHVRAVAPDWVSWTHKGFPMGLALAGALILYPLFGLWIA